MIDTLQSIGFIAMVIWLTMNEKRVKKINRLTSLRIQRTEEANRMLVKLVASLKKDIARKT
jgi:hypothetical protein